MADRDFVSESGLAVRLTRNGEGPVFDRFFAGYDRAFVLPDEKEDVAGFRSCMALNHGAAHEEIVARYGAFVELCMVFDDAESGVPVGGANLIAMPVKGRDGVRITANLNYIYIDAAVRGRGYFARVVGAASEIVARAFPEAPGQLPLVFIEQNDPFAMSAESYARDTRFTGLDQIDRLRIWARRGALVVDFPYVQPPLSADQEADDTLVYSVLGAEGQALDACLLTGHLQRFFGISVLKGALVEKQPEAQRQIAALERNCDARETIALIDPAVLLDRLDGPASITEWPGRRPASFLSALKA